MRFMALVVLFSLVGCAQKTPDVSYRPPQKQLADWYPIPTQKILVVDNIEPGLNRPPIGGVNDSVNNSQLEALAVRQLVDGFGNLSLDVNRNAALTWELLELSVARLGLDVVDRNRSEYLLVLGDPERTGRGWLSRTLLFFTEDPQNIRLLLVPKVTTTGITAEYDDSQVLSDEDNRRLMYQLQAALLQET